MRPTLWLCSERPRTGSRRATVEKTISFDAGDATEVLEIDPLPDGGLVQATEAEKTIRDAGAAITIPQPAATREVTSLEELGALLS